MTEIHSYISAEESDSTPHVTITYKASSGENLPEVNITPSDGSVGSESNLTWVPSTNKRGSETNNSPQHSKGDVSRTLSDSSLNRAPSTSREELYEAQMSVDIEENLLELPSQSEGSLTNMRSKKDCVGTTDSTERLRGSPEPSCMSGKTHLLYKVPGERLWAYTVLIVVE